MNKKFAVVLLFAILAVLPASAEWKENLNALLNHGFDDIATSSVKEMTTDQAQVQKVAAQTPSWKALVNHIQNKKFSQSDNRGKLLLNTMTGKDGKDRPWVLYIPDSYWPKRSTPVMVALHGGVSRVSLSEDPMGWAKESEWLKLAKNNGWFAIFPYGQEGATWWDEVGMTNIRRQLQITKENFNIDDDRVYLTGFSDGASAGFLHAMICPDDFAAIVALNGHMGVGSLDGDLPIYATNMANTPIYTVTTDNDGLYPTAIMSKTIEMAIKAGANIQYRQLPGTHSFDYAPTELPLISNFLNRNVRNPIPEKIFWETGSIELGKCKWLEISEILPDEPAEWHKDYNCALVSDRVSVGFMPKKAIKGVRVGKVMEKTYAVQIGLKSDDVIIKAGNIDVANIDDLDKAKSLVKRGDQFNITVLRGSDTVELKGTLPAPELYNLFKREVPSAAIKACHYGNKIEVSGSRVGRFKVFISPDQFNINEQIEITFNTIPVFKGMTRPDPEFILTNYLKNRDRKMLPIAQIDINLHELIK